MPVVSASGWGRGARQLLRRLRDVMAGAGTAQQRLDRIVRLIAADMVAEVCSVYLMRAGEVLELFASEGLRAASVHHTWLRVGEGLVGDVAAHARTLAVADARAHPSFAYRPETGEEIYHALAGVPILRGGRVLGVLVVQNRAHRNYSEEETESLETVAMVIAELIAGGELVGADEVAQADAVALAPRRLNGVRLNGGLASGVAVLHRRMAPPAHMVAEDPGLEAERLRQAVMRMHGAIDRMLADSELGRDGEHREILESYRMIAADRGWLRRIGEAIETGLTAEAAVQMVQNDTRARMLQASDPYLRERLQDLEDLASRLQQHLAGTGAPDLAPDADMILIARTLGPAELLDYPRERLRGLVLEEGSPTSHVVIIARAFDIPVVGRVPRAHSILEAMDPVIVDGDRGVVYVRPGDDVRQRIAESIEARARQRKSYEAFRRLPAVTRDGVEITLNINAGLVGDLADLDQAGVAGVGLFRTEIPFMLRAAFPGVAEQETLYREVIELAGDRPVVFRTLDIGGDKLLPYFDRADDDNPAMGWRSIRIALDRPAMLRQQLRALIRATSGATLTVMFPMIAEVSEFVAARRLLDMELERAQVRDQPPPKTVRVGVMLEVPSLAWQLPPLLRRADFVSVGSNDLFQFLFASDRGNPRLAERYDPLSPAALLLLRDIVGNCEAAGKGVALCGEMAGRPLEAMALIGLGFRNLSMFPGEIGPVKAMIRSLSVQPLRDYMQELTDLEDHSLRERLRNFANDHGIEI